MKFKHSILFVLLALLGCTQAATDLHNGEYIFAEESSKNVVKESIIIKGDKATLRMHSLFNRSKLSKSIYLCLHYPDKVDLYISKQRPISIPVNKRRQLNLG